MQYFGIHNVGSLREWARLHLRRFKEGSYYIRGKDNVLAIKGTIIRSKIRVIGSGNKIIIPRNTLINNVVVDIVGNNCELVVGNNVRYSGGNFWFRDNNSKIIINDNCTIEGANLHAEEGCMISVGENCMLSYDIDVRTSDSHSILDLHSNERINTAKDVVIGSKVWIGAKASILKGVTIKEGSIIGAHSIVTKDVSQNCLAVGCPARIIAENIKWERDKI